MHESTVIECANFSDGTEFFNGFFLILQKSHFSSLEIIKYFLKIYRMCVRVHVTAILGH